MYNPYTHKIVRYQSGGFKLFGFFPFLAPSRVSLQAHNDSSCPMVQNTVNSHAGEIEPVLFSLVCKSSESGGEMTHIPHIPFLPQKRTDTT